MLLDIHHLTLLLYLLLLRHFLNGQAHVTGSSNHDVHLPKVLVRFLQNLVKSGFSRRDSLLSLNLLLGAFWRFFHVLTRNIQIGYGSILVFLVTEFGGVCEVHKALFVLLVALGVLK